MVVSQYQGEDCEQKLPGSHCCPMPMKYIFVSFFLNKCKGSVLKKKLQGGKLYLKKGVVADVTTPRCVFQKANLVLSSDAK